MLLFQVGLEANLADFRRVGRSAFLVAVLGVIAPMMLGWGAGAILLPDRSWPIHMFLGATLCATSVGITARVLRDLGKSNDQGGSDRARGRSHRRRPGTPGPLCGAGHHPGSGHAGRTAGVELRSDEPAGDHHQGVRFSLRCAFPWSIRQPHGVQGRQLPSGQRHAHGVGTGDLLPVFVASFADGASTDRRRLRRRPDPGESSVSRACRARSGRYELEDLIRPAGRPAGTDLLRDDGGAG